MSSGQNQFLSLAPVTSVPPRLTSGQQFLPLAPDVSDSYPSAQRARAASSASSSTASGGSSPTLAPTATAAADQDPSVAVASTRVLKLSPVYWGAHAEEHQGDYHDVKSA